MLFTEGTIVTHPTFGPGRVVLRSWTHAWVYFPDVAGSAEAAVKKLQIESSKLKPAPRLSDSRLLYVPAKLVNGVLEFPKSTRISHNDAVAHFLKRYPKGFKDPGLFESELEYKRDAERRSTACSARIGGGISSPRNVFRRSHRQLMSSFTPRIFPRYRRS